MRSRIKDIVIAVLVAFSFVTGCKMIMDGHEYAGAFFVAWSLIGGFFYMEDD